MRCVCLELGWIQPALRLIKKKRKEGAIEQSREQLALPWTSLSLGEEAALYKLTEGFHYIFLFYYLLTCAYLSPFFLSSPCSLLRANKLKTASFQCRFFIYITDYCLVTISHQVFILSFHARNINYTGHYWSFFLFFYVSNNIYI